MQETDRAMTHDGEAAADELTRLRHGDDARLPPRRLARGQHDTSRRGPRLHVPRHFLLLLFLPNFPRRAPIKTYYSSCTARSRSFACMMSSGGGCGHSRPASAAGAVVYDDLVEVRERAAMLQTMLQGSSPPMAGDAGELMEGMMSRLSSALEALGTSGGGGVTPSSSGAGRIPGGRRKRTGAAAGGPLRRSSSSSRRRTKSPFLKTVTATTLNDGKSWRKYGQKCIQGSINQRSYYRCTHKAEQGCMATRQVQESESNPSELVISYFGHHTCRDPSTIPVIVDGAAAPPDCANLISFASAIAGGASTSTSTAVPYRFVKEATDHHHHMLSCLVGYSCSPAQESVSEGALSSTMMTPGSTPSPATREKFTWPGQLVVAAQRTSASTAVGSAPPEYWPPSVGVAGDDMVGASNGSFPSSPSSLGFMTGSYGSFANDVCHDDLFGFDP